MLAPRTSGSAGSAGSAVGVEHLQFFRQGPCCLAAASRAGSVWLADARDPCQVPAQLRGMAPGEFAVSLETSPDGWLVYGGSCRNKVGLNHGLFASYSWHPAAEGCLPLGHVQRGRAVNGRRRVPSAGDLIPKW